MEIYAQPELAIGKESIVGESPVWDRRRNILAWVDLDQGTIFESDISGSTTTEFHLDTILGAIAPRNNGSGYAVAIKEGFGLWDGSELTIIDHFLPEKNRRMNDAKCDSSGRFWGGSTQMDSEVGRGALHRWDGKATNKVMMTGLTLPNGIGWSAQDDVMFLVDSVAKKIFSMSFDPDGGEIGEAKVFAEINSGLPDGLAVDVEGCIWLAVWGGSEVLRLSPNGKVIGKIPMPVTQPSSCAFDEEGNLYITSARAGISETDLAKQPLAGSVFVLSTSTLGVPVAAFNG
jgi:sugar lactone lactonase YvrE